MKGAKRVIFIEKNKVAVEAADIPEPNKNEVLIRTGSTLISAGTELSILTGTHVGLKDKNIGYPPFPFYPFYPGYSNAGDVIAVGDRVRDFEVGDRVVSWTKHCSHVVCPADLCAVRQIPNGVSYDQAVFTCLGIVALHGIRMSRLTMGESVLILGQGLVGQLSLQLAKQGGASPIIAVDLLEKRLNVSEVCGADHVLNPSKCNVEREVQDIMDARGVNVIIEATGNPAIFPIAFKMASKLGRVIVLGGPRGESKLGLYSELQRKGLSLIGAYVDLYPTQETPYYPWTRQESMKYLLNLLSKGYLKVERLITHKVAFTEAPSAYEDLIHYPSEALGVILDWSKIAQ